MAHFRSTSRTLPTDREDLSIIYERFPNFDAYTQLCLIRSLMAFSSSELQNTKYSEVILFSFLTHLLQKILQIFDFPDLKETYNKNFALENLSQIFEIFINLFKLKGFVENPEICAKLKEFIPNSFETALEIVWKTFEDPFLQLFHMTRKALCVLIDLSRFLESNFCCLFGEESRAEPALALFRRDNMLRKICNRLALLSFERKVNIYLIKRFNTLNQPWFGFSKLNQ